MANDLNLSALNLPDRRTQQQKNADLMRSYSKPEPPPPPETQDERTRRLVGGYNTLACFEELREEKRRQQTEIERSTISLYGQHSVQTHTDNTTPIRMNAPTSLMPVYGEPEDISGLREVSPTEYTDFYGRRIVNPET